MRTPPPLALRVAVPALPALTLRQNPIPIKNVEGSNPTLLQI